MSLAVNPKVAVAECLAQVGGSPSVLLFHTTVGHNAKQLTAAAAAAAPDAVVTGCTGSGVISSGAVSEKMRAVACMAITGDQVAVAFRGGLDGATSEEVARDAGKELAAALPGLRQILVYCQGLDPAGDRVIAGLESVFGPDVVLLGGTAADNGKARRTTLFARGEVATDGLLLIGLSDPTLDVVSGSHHGSTPIGMPFAITACDGNHVLEIEGEPAWPFLMNRLGAPATSGPSDVLPIAGLGEKLGEAEAAEYHNSHILCVAFKISEDHQTFWLPRTVEVGTEFVLVRRDEDRIFAGVDALAGRIRDRIGERELVAMVHADCMARGRLMLDQVNKDEIIGRMQGPLGGADVPWLGLYGYGEFCPLGGKNRFHAYTTSLFALVRDA